MLARDEVRLAGERSSAISEPVLWALCALSEEGRLAASVVRRLSDGTAGHASQAAKERLGELCERFGRDVAELEAAVEGLMSMLIGPGSLR